MNQVSDALEGAVDLEDFQKLGFGDDDESDIGNIPDSETDDGDSDKYKWLFEAVADPVN